MSVTKKVCDISKQYWIHNTREYFSNSEINLCCLLRNIWRIAFCCSFFFSHLFFLNIYISSTSYENIDLYSLISTQRTLQETYFSIHMSRVKPRDQIYTVDLLNLSHSLLNAKRYKIHVNIRCSVKAEIFVGNSGSRKCMNTE